MKRLIINSLIIFFAIFFTDGVFGDWNGTFYVTVKEGEVDCGDTQHWTGSVGCTTYIDVDVIEWHGYQLYTFNLDAPNIGEVHAEMYATDDSDPIQECAGEDDFEWGHPPNPPTVSLSIETDSP